MMSRKLGFNGSAEWVIQGACDIVAKHTRATTSVRYISDTSGTITIQADTPGEVELAIAHLSRDPICSKHLKAA